MALSELKSRGLGNMLIVSTDNLPGFTQAIEAIYPNIEIQKCIIHQISSSTKFVSYKDIKELIEAFNRQLRKVTKNKSIFPNDFSLIKSLYLAMADASLKWTSRIRSWDKLLSQLNHN